MKYMKIYIHCQQELLDTAGAVLIAHDVPGYVTNSPSNLEHLDESEIPPWDYIDDELKNEIMSVSNIEFYLPNDKQGKETLNEIQEHINAFDNADSFRISVENVDDSTWKNKWKEYFKPLKVGNAFYIKPSWEEIAEKHSRHIIKMDPENAFGSGTHATTKLCLIEIEKQKPDNLTVLDLGCGSGILGIGAKLLGAKGVTFVDIDNYVIETCRRNAQNNNLNMKALEFYCGNILEDTALCDKIGFDKYNLMTVNIMADIIITMIPMLDKLLKKGGVIIFSGIITQRLDDVLEVLETYKYEIQSVNTMDGWCAVTAKCSK